MPLLVVVLLTKFEGRMILGVPQGARRRGDLRASPRSPTGSTATWRGAGKQVTPLGQFIDPFADKLLTIAAFISLVQMDLAPAWMVAIIIGREFAVTALRSIAYARGVVDAGVAARQDQDGRAGRGDPRADSRHGSSARVLRDRAGRRCGWSVVAALVSAADYFRRFNVSQPAVGRFRGRRPSSTPTGRPARHALLALHWRRL